MFSRATWRAAACALTLTVVAAACSDAGSTSVPSGSSNGSASLDPSASTAARSPVADDGEIVIDPSAAGRPFDRRLLGTNAPAWISPDVLADRGFQQSVVDMGTTVVRMPGGSWSSSYDWLACENDDEDGCYWTWASRPADFAGFLAATGLEGMWTVSFNGTAEEAAALVAYFNGAVGDTRAIGVDRNGRDWNTVGTWAELRAANGHPAPQPIRLWEVGNEIYGAKGDAAGDCESWGWEDVWTCDGELYVQGDEQHDGFLRFREAMLAVDPEISVGAVGIGGSQSEWSNFGNEVIDGTGDALDFYVVHDYGFNSGPSIDDVLSRPRRSWPDTIGGVRDALDDRGSERAVPIAVTEYNMFSFVDGDTDGLMAEAVSSMYVAETIGQMAEQGVQVANQWNLINGRTSTGSDYGIFDPDSLAPNPQFFGIAMWSSMGDELVPAGVGFDDDALSVYATRSRDGTMSLLVINPTGESRDATIRMSDGSATYEAVADEVSASALDAQQMSYNGVPAAGPNLDAIPGRSIGTVDQDGTEHTFAPFSITVVHARPTPTDVITTAISGG